MSSRALALEVRYLRDGEHEGNMFVSRTAGDLELTTPSYIIRLHADQALELYTEIARMFGWSTQ